jgi:outer membrane murein-binding lipoprotein Lpp
MKETNDIGVGESRCSPHFTCPFFNVALFWKVTMLVAIALLLLLVLTTWSASRNLAAYTSGVQDLQTKHEQLSVKVDGAVRATLENRAIQTEIRGLLIGDAKDKLKKP